MREQIEKLNQHYIICGYGETGRIVVSELQKAKIPFIVIEQNPDSLQELIEKRILYVEGDATQEEVLQKACIEKAKGLVACLTKDAENLFIVLSARDLNADLTIVAKAIHHSAHHKLKRAGATNTVSPTEIGGHRIASMLIRPAVINFLDTMTRAGEIELDLEDVPIEEGSELCGLLLREAQIPQKTGLIIIAIEQVNKEMIFNPGSDCVLDAGDHLYALGRPEQIEKLIAIAKG